MKNQIFKRNLISIACIAMICANTTVFASSLTDVLSSTSTSTSTEIEQVEQTEVEQTESVKTEETTTSTTTEVAPSPSKDNDYNSLYEATKLDIDLNDPDVLKIASPVKRITGVICTILLYFITCAIPFVTLLDICYIKITPLQSILGNGYNGVSENGGATGMGPGMGMGTGMGMGMGTGMYGGGYGGRYGGGYGMNNMNSMAASGNMFNARHRTKLVSAAAMNAVATEGSMGPDGKTRSALGMYARSMIVEMVATPILLTLAISGKLVEIGFKIGSGIVNAIGGI